MGRLGGPSGTGLMHWQKRAYLLILKRLRPTHLTRMWHPMSSRLGISLQITCRKGNPGMPTYRQ
eukprot:798656-Karenia_brevis.AAC.1